MKKLNALSPFALVILIMFPPSIAAGASWPSETALVTTPGLDIFPSLARLSGGRLLVVWSTDIYGGLDLFYGLYDMASGEFVGPITLDAGPGSDVQPATALLPDGKVFLVWANNGQRDYELYFSVFNGISWTGKQQLTKTIGDDLGPSVVADANGLVTVFWQAPRGSTLDLFSKSSSDGGKNWTVETKVPISSDNLDELGASAAIGKDGRLWLTWQSNKTGNYDLSVSHVENSQWVPPTLLTTDLNEDSEPSLTVATDGGLWLIWQSDRVSAGGVPQQDIYYKKSHDGVNWSGDSRLTTDTNDDAYPSAFAAGPGRISVVWATNRPAEADFNLYYGELTFHDLSVQDVKPGATSVPIGQVLPIYITTVNEGAFTEQAALTVYANNTVLASVTSSLRSGVIWTTTILWQTQGWSPGIYNIRGSVAPVPLEEDSLDNEKTGAPISLGVRDISLVSMNNPAFTYQGINIDIPITVENKGSTTETFNISLYYNGTLISTTTINQLAPGSTATVHIFWDTSTVNPGNYVVKAYSPPLTGETNTADNTIESMTFVRLTGDVNGDGRVNLDDLLLVFVNQGTANLTYDVTGDGKVNLDDLLITFVNQGRKL